MLDHFFSEKKKSLCLLFLVIFVTAAVSAVITWLAMEASTDKTAGDVRSTDKIIVLYTNDVHCSIEETENTLGFKAFAALKDWAEKVSGYVTVVDCGDAIQGESMGTLSDGESMVALMNAVGYDVCTFGNHEFDYGIDKILEIANNQSKAQYVSCNFTDLSTGKTVTEPYTILDYDGISVAYVGISTPETITSSAPACFMDEQGAYKYSFCQGEDGARLYKAVQSAVDSARKEGADYVIALAHLGINETAVPYRSTDIIEHTTGIDVVLDGHSHSVIQSDRIENQDGKEVILSSTGSKLTNVGCLMIDTKGTVDLSDDSVHTSLISNDAYKIMGESIANEKSEYEELLHTVVAHTEVTLSTKSENGHRMVRCRETNIGDFCADAYRMVSGADIAVVNGGGIRSDLEVGDITYQDLFNVYPFGNMLCVVQASGQQILDMLEMAYKDVESEYETADGPIGEFGGFLQVSGITFTIDTSMKSSVLLDENGVFQTVSKEHRVKNVKILKEETGEYVKLDPKATYALASNSYLLRDGGDGFNMFMDNTYIRDEFMLDYQALISYIENQLNGNIGETYQEVQGRITIQSVK